MGDIVKVYSTENDGLYRAKILKNNNGSYDVFYIDYGNIETVQSNVIYELADELKKVFFLKLLIYLFIYFLHNNKNNYYFYRNSLIYIFVYFYLYDFSQE